MNRDRDNARARERHAAKVRNRYDIGRELWVVCVYCELPYLQRRADWPCPRPQCRVTHHAVLQRGYDAAARVRAAGFGAPIEHFHFWEVYERDGGLCWICGEPTLGDWTTAMAPLSPTLDHVLAVALGGEHSLANVRLSHRVCNSSRRTAEVVPALPAPVARPRRAGASRPLGEVVLEALVLVGQVARERAGGRPLANATGERPS